MINKQVIDTLYKKYRKAPKSIDDLDFALLFDGLQEHHNAMIDIDIDTNRLNIGSIDGNSPFHSLPLNRIHAILPFEEWVALVMPASIIFLNRTSPKVSVHIKEMKPSILDKIRYRMHQEEI